MPKPTTKSRQELRSRFVRNAIPTEADFADLIAASLNLADDGLLKLPDQPFSLVRQKSDQPVLRLFADPVVETAAWQLQLIGTDKPGLGLAGQDGKLAWVVDGATSNVGIGTSTPGQRLVVQGVWNDGKDPESNLTNGGTLAIKSGSPQLDFIDSDANAKDWCIHVNNGKMHFIRSPWEYSDLFLDGTGNVGVGTDYPSHRLTVSGTWRDGQAAGTDLTHTGILSIRSDRPQLDFIDTDATKKDWAIHVNDSKMFFIRSPWDDANLVLDGAGNVGIGTQSPSHRLTVSGPLREGQAPGTDLTNTGILSIRSDRPQLDFIDTDDNNKDWAIHVNNNKMHFVRSPWDFSDLVLDGTGNVGVGTNTPSHRLTVSGTWPDSQAAGSDLSKAGILSIRSNQPQLDFIDTDASAKDWAIHVNGSKMYFIRSPWESSDLVLDGTGNVGVGTDNPSHRLTVSGTWRDGQAAGTDLTHTGILSIRSDRPQLDFIDTDATNKDWAIHVNDSKMFFIRSPWDDANLVLDGAGNVGIGSQAPSHRLTIEGAWSDRQATGSDLTKAGQLSIRSNAPQLDFVDTDANHKDWAIHVNNNKMYFIRSPWEYSDLLLDGTGNVGIGTDAPTVKLHVAGSVRVDSDLTVVGTLSASGGFISSVWFATGNGPIEDGDSGRIQSRTLTIKKKFADTVVRILYCDNFRVLGSESNASARWEIRVNGASLSTPIIADRYSIDNIHTNGMVMGFARGLAAGTHEIQVWVGATPGNIVCNSATGWNSSTWSLAAEEIRQA